MNGRHQLHHQLHSQICERHGIIHGTAQPADSGPDCNWGSRSRLRRMLGRLRDRLALPCPEPIPPRMLPGRDPEPEWEREALLRSRRPHLYDSPDEYWGQQIRDLYAWTARMAAERITWRRQLGLEDPTLLDYPAFPLPIAA